MKRILLIALLLLLSDGLCYANQDDYCKNVAYRNYDAIKIRLAELAFDNPGYVNLMSAGTITTEKGRNIQGVIITNSTSTTPKATVLITGAIHANEWIGTEVAIGLVEYLVTNKTNTTPVVFSSGIPGLPGISGSSNMSIKTLLENTKIVIIPVLNPDGYVFSMTYYDVSCLPLSTIATDARCSYHIKNYEQPGSADIKMLYSGWRKNLRPLSTTWTDAIGVDINRNFDANFSAPTDTSYVSMMEDTYGGTEFMSEKETKAVKYLFDTYRFKAAIDFHSGEERVLYPYGINADIDSTVEKLRPNSNTKDLYLFEKMGKKIAKYVGFVDSDGTVSAGTVSTTYYTTHGRGLARDWAYDKYKIAAFNIELAIPHQPAEERIKTICEQKIYGPLWLMFWAADTGFRNRPTLHLGQ